MNSLRQINAKKEPLTIEKLRTFKGYENISDSEAEHIVLSIERFTVITYEYFQEMKKHCEHLKQAA